VEILTLISQKYFDDDYTDDDDDVRIMSTTTADDDNDNDITPYCYWLCNRKAELKVYTDFGNVLHLCNCVMRYTILHID